MDESGIEAQGRRGPIGQQHEHGRHARLAEEKERQDHGWDRDERPLVHERDALQDEAEAQTEDDASHDWTAGERRQPGHGTADTHAEPEEAGDDRGREDGARRDHVRLGDRDRRDGLHR